MAAQGDIAPRLHVPSSPVFTPSFTIGQLGGLPAKSIRASFKCVEFAES